jgi:heme exporter protein D
MQWHSISDFFAMGGYGFYVWGSFGLTAAVMLAEVVAIRHRRAELMRHLHDEFFSEELPS